MKTIDHDPALNSAVRRCQLQVRPVEGTHPFARAALRWALVAMTLVFLAFGSFCSSAQATDLTPWDWSPDTDIQGGTITPAAEVTVPAGGSVYCSITAASDMDTWTQYQTGNPNPIIGFGFDTLEYSWDDGGAGGTFNPATGANTSWTAPQAPGTYTITCTIDDTPTPIVAPETGSRDDTAVTKEITVKVVAVKSIQYRINGEGDFTDVSDTLKVPVGQVVEFKALPDAEGSQWPMGTPTWGGTSGASGGGETTTVTFNTQSTTETDFKTVTATCGNTITANVIVYTLSFKARRKGSEGSYSASAKVAAGAKSSDEHMGELLVQAAPAVSGIPVGAVTIKSGGLGGTSVVTAQVSLDGSTTDGSGQIAGSFTSGNRADPTADTTTVVELDANPAPLVPSHPTVSFNQAWNEIVSDAWTFDEYFEYDEPSLVTYEMALNGDVHITSHSMEILTTGLAGLEWNTNIGEDWNEDGIPDGAYEERVYLETDIDPSGFWAWESLSVFSSVNGNGGFYSADQTVYFDPNFLVEKVWIDIYDNDVFGSEGKFD